MWYMRSKDILINSSFFRRNAIGLISSRNNSKILCPSNTELMICPERRSELICNNLTNFTDDDNDYSVKLMKNQPKIAIIGAGIAGLSAAHRLIQVGFRDVTVYEATDRPGGRIQTCEFGDSIVEMGAEWLEGSGPCNCVYSLACQEGFKPKIINSEQRLEILLKENAIPVKSRTATLAQNIYKKVKSDSRLKIFKDGAPSSSLHYFIENRTDEILSVLGYDDFELKTIINDLADESRQTWGACTTNISTRIISAKSKLPGYLSKIPEGLTAIMAPLLTEIGQDNVQYYKSVKTIKWRGHPRIQITMSDGEVVQADYAIVTIPLGILKEQHQAMFYPELNPKKVEAINTLGFGKITKIKAQYAVPWWPKDSESWLRLIWNSRSCRKFNWIQGIGEIHLNNSGVLSTTLGGDEAINLESLSTDEIAVDLTKCLRKFTASHIVPLPIDLLKSEWNSHPYYQGAITYLKPISNQNHLNVLGQPEPDSSNRLLFAGEATIPNYFSTLHGARISGLREAERIFQLTKSNNDFTFQ